MKRILVLLVTTLTVFGCSKEESQPKMYKLTVSSNPTEGGTINPTSGEYEEETEVTLRVNTNTHYEFDKWSGSWSGSESPLTLTMDGDKNIVGNFKLMDSDGDGVTDDIDQCPETPNGEGVDENGCIPNPLYLDENGVTIKSHDWGEVGDTGQVNGVTYTIVSEEQLREMTYNNQDVSKVCTSKISNMDELFPYWTSVVGDISSWDVSNVTEMGGMFGSSLTNGDLSNWDVSSVTSMSSMFYDSQFNGDISSWDVSSVRDMSNMFYDSQFNGDISSWDVSSVLGMGGMFHGSQFNGNISNWDVSSVSNMVYMFENSQFNGDLSNWNVSNVTICYRFSNNTPQWTLPKPNFTNCDPN